MGPQRQILCQTPKGAPPSPPASHWLPTPKTYRLHYPLLRESPRKDTMREHRDTTIRKRRLFFAGAVARQNEGRLPSWVMFGTVTGGVGPRPGGQPKTWRKCLVDDVTECFEPLRGPRNTPRWCLELRPRCGKRQQRKLLNCRLVPFSNGPLISGTHLTDH